MHNVFTEVVYRTALGSNDDGRLHMRFAHGANAGKVCKTELLQYLSINYIQII